MLRRLRIAASVFFGALTLAVLALWVRSYWYLDFIARDAPRYQQITSLRGSCQLQIETRSRPGAVRTPWQRRSDPTSLLTSHPSRRWLQFPKVYRGGNLAYLRIPYWTAAVAFLALALAPTQRLRFTTRTLLTATTLLAIVLGAGAWATS